MTSTLQAEAKDLAREHERLARELYIEATSARRDGNFHVSDALVEQADLHTITEFTLVALVEALAGVWV